MPKPRPPYEVAPGVWWLGSSNSQEFLQVNTYLLVQKGKAILFDPGPVPCFREVFGAAGEVVERDRLVCIVLSHQDPDVCASLPLWEEQGFRGDLVAHWRTGLLLPSYALRSNIINIYKDETGRIEGFPALDFLVAPYLHAPGTILAHDRASGSLFSGDLFGALGTNLSLEADEHYLSRMVAFHEQYMPSSAMLKAAIEDIRSLGCQRILPQHGSILEGTAVSRAIDSLGTAECGKLDVETAQRENRKNQEIDRLRDDWLKIQEDLISLKENALKDGLTGLWKREYLDEYIPIFMEKYPAGALACLRLDHMREYNSEFGYAAGDEAIAAFAALVLEEKGSDILLFRDTGPSVDILIPDADKARDELVRLQARVRESRSFLKKREASAALVSIAEASDPREIASILATRLRLLDGMGPGSISASALLENSERAGVLLIVEPDHHFALFLQRHFRALHYQVQIASSGSEALRLARSLIPKVIVSELNVPQYDGPDIRRILVEEEGLSKLPFLLMSGIKSESDVKRAQNLGILHYLKKPLMLGELEGLVEALWEGADEQQS